MLARRTILAPIISFFGIIAIWELIDTIFKIPQIVIPNPHEIMFSFISNFNMLAANAGITLFESILGFLLGTITAILLAILFVYSKTANDALYPYAIALKATPLYALAPLLVLWFGNDLGSKIAMSALVCFFPVLVNAVKGLTSIDSDAVNLLKTYGASRWQIFIKLRFPTSFSYIFPALKMSTTFAVVGATIAEFTGSSRGIGHIIVTSTYYINTSLMFAAIILISLAGIFFFFLVGYLERKVVFWERYD